jgi:hypothetical protein
MLEAVLHRTGLVREVTEQGTFSYSALDGARGQSVVKASQLLSCFIFYLQQPVIMLSKHKKDEIRLATLVSLTYSACVQQDRLLSGK